MKAVSFQGSHEVQKHQWRESLLGQFNFLSKASPAITVVEIVPSTETYGLRDEKYSPGLQNKHCPLVSERNTIFKKRALTLVLLRAVYNKPENSYANNWLI